MEQNLKVILLDDELHALSNLASAIHQIDPSVEICGQFTDPIDAIVYAQNNPIDIFFLDISMSILNGFEVLEKVGNYLNFKTVFVTAFSEYAIRAIKHHVFDYLLKPIELPELKECLIASKLATQNAKASQKMVLQSTDKIHFIDVTDIRYLRSDNSYTKLVLNDHPILSSKPISHFHASLNSSSFFRCHNSYIVHKKYISEYNKKNKSLVLINGEEVPVSRSKKEELLQWLI